MGALVPLRLTKTHACRRNPRFSDISLHDFILWAFRFVHHHGTADATTATEDADGAKISAEYKDGVPQVHLPKSEKTKPKIIEVKVS